MCEVLSFASKRPRAARRPSHRDGELVIFPGIRVEYHEGPAPAAPAPASEERCGTEDAITASGQTPRSA
jgi:hypothetical protein